MSSSNLSESKNDKLWFILRLKVFEEKITGAFQYFRENGIEPILIKGWAASIEYPEKYERYFGDIDLCVAPEFFEKASELLLTETGRKFKVDLHCGLRHLDTICWEDLFENSVLKELDGVKIRILRPEDHFRVLTVHWLTDGGAVKERLLDLYYLLINHQKDFDWHRCLQTVSNVRRNWIIKMIGLLEKYCGLEISSLPFASESRDLPDWFIKTMESEWTDEIKLVPIHTTLLNARDFINQLRKRFPPNPIQSTIDMEGKIDNSSRVYYQIGSVFLRFKPSISRIFVTAKSHIFKK